MSSRTFTAEQLTAYQEKMIAEGEKRMKRACSGGNMRPETMYYELHMQRQVLAALRRLQAMETEA